MRNRTRNTLLDDSAWMDFCYDAQSEDGKLRSMDIDSHWICSKCGWRLLVEAVRLPHGDDNPFYEKKTRLTRIFGRHEKMEVLLIGYRVVGAKKCDMGCEHGGEVVRDRLLVYQVRGNPLALVEGREDDVIEVTGDELNDQVVRWYKEHARSEIHKQYIP